MADLAAVGVPVPEAKAIVLTIRVVEGRISLDGPLADKVLCYGLLEAAKDTLRDYHTANRRIVPVAGALPAGLKL